VAALDVDHFKRINDTHGHAVGDAVLQQLAQLLRHRLRSADLLARTGGEEFLAVLVGSTPQQAAEICERLRLAVAEHDWAAITPGLAVRISVGIAGGTPPLAADTLLNRADHALYAAKRGGRNRVHVD
jgi:diguanylate cyclase (GGDEF)-like protein